MQQVFGTLVIAQVLFAMRTEVALAAKAQLREVSLPLLVRWVPELALAGQDPIRTLAQRGRDAGIIRPFRGREYALPCPDLQEYKFPPDRPPPAKARYAGKQGTHASSTQSGYKSATRKHGWGLRQRRPRIR